ncbi:MAG: phosphotransferase [Armatimonadetes bacterium]|nr:phosphotransferase [Armatimonadota bacterium]
MKRQWDADIAITSELCRLLVEKQFPELSPVEIEIIGEGWDNTAFLINGKHLFRLPRRKTAVYGLETENRVLPLLAPHLSLPIPVPIFVGEPSEIYPFPFSGYRHIPGATACKAGLTTDERTVLAEPLAHFLKSLHRVPLERIADLGIEPDRIHRLDLEKRTPMLYQYMENLPKEMKVRKHKVAEIVDSASKTTFREVRAPVHGDLYFRHLLIGDDRNLAGVIDWGDVHLGNPAIDIAIAFGFLPPEGRERFREKYGPIDEETWKVARFRALYMAILLLAYGHDTRESHLTREALLSLDYVMAD